MNYNTGNALDEKFNALLFQIMRLHYIRVHDLLANSVCHGTTSDPKASVGKDGRCQCELGEILHLRPATISVILRRMEKSGLVKRQADPNDRRVSVLPYPKRQGNTVGSRTGFMKYWKTNVAKDSRQKKRLLLSHFLLRIRNNLLQANNGPAWQ